MAVIGPFSDFLLEDDQALEEFLLANRVRHITYVRLTRVRNAGTLDGPVDADWMQRHGSHHVALATAPVVVNEVRLTSADTKVLLMPHKWRTQAELIDFMDLHNRLHLNLDRLLKLAVR